MFDLFTTQNFSKIFFKAKMPLDIPDLPGPVFKRGCNTNSFSHTIGQLKYPAFKFREASDIDREYNIPSESSFKSSENIRKFVKNCKTSNSCWITQYGNPFFYDLNEGFQTC